MADGSDSAVGDTLKTYGWVLQLAAFVFTVGGAWTAVHYQVASLEQKDTQIDRRLDARDDYITSIDRRLYETESKANRAAERVENLDHTVERNFQQNATDLKRNSAQLDDIFRLLMKR